MTKTLNAKNKPFSWSYTALVDFEGCPARYAAARFYCTSPFQDSEALRWGNRVHKAAELAIKGKDHKDPEAFAPVAPYVSALKASGHFLEAETEITLNENLDLTGWFAKDAWLRCKLDVVVTKHHPNTAVLYDWKGLAVSTKIPTPGGWETVESIKEGAELFAKDGSVCKVIGKSPVFNRKCFEIVFRDGAEVVCDDVHLWESGVSGLSKQGLSVRSTAEIFGMVSSGRGVYLPVAEPAKYQEVSELPIDPYVLGCWLGDGAKSRAEICKPNEQMFLEIEKRGYSVGPNIGGAGRCASRTVYGLAKPLRDLGVLNNKHIPQMYLTAGRAQRLSLLQGLLDTDGSWNFTRSQAVFTTMSEDFAAQMSELLASLGQKPYCVKLKKFGFGKHCFAYDVIFTPRNVSPFLTHRKAQDAAGAVGTVKSGRRYVKTMREVLSVPTQCLAVDSQDRTYLCTDRYIVTHNTGKIKEGDDQLRICAAALEKTRAGIDFFEGRYIWTKFKQVTGIKPIKREEIPQVWENILPRVARMQAAWDADNFPERPSGLCPYCLVTECRKRR